MNNIIYLDAAASALKPESVIKAETEFLRDSYANAGRGVCARAVAVDTTVRNVRKKVADFIGAEDETQIIFTSGTTDGMNRIAKIIDNPVSGETLKNKTIMVSDLDHHSARLPFEVLRNSFDCKIVLCPMDRNYNLMCSDLPKADVFVITAMSNVLGVAQDVQGLISAARKKNPNVITIVDAAQYVVHEKIDVQKWNCDFMCFSAHKIGADTGLGVMYIREPNRWETPDKFGGGMVSRITGSAASHSYDIKWETAPAKFEAGTLPLTQIIGLEPAIEHLISHRPNLDLIKYLYDRLSKNENIKVITERDSAMFTFYPKNMHVLDFGVMAGTMGLCLRVGNMCAGWLHNLMELSGTVRISVGSWNTMSDVQKAADIIEGIVK